MTDYGTFRVDTRESEEVVNMFIALQMELENKGQPAFEIEREQLVTGDVIAGNICFERKEEGDFVASICDGRLKSQAEKMSLNFDHKYYVIVGDMWANTGRVNPRAILGAQASLAVKHDATFLQCNNKAGFAYLVYNVVKRHAEGQTFDPTTKVLQNYNIEPTQRFANMLSCTGIGPRRAGILAVACDMDMQNLYAMTEEDMYDLPNFGEESARKVYAAIRGSDVK